MSTATDSSFDQLTEQNEEETKDSGGSLDGNGQIDGEPIGSEADQAQLTKFCEKLSKMELDMTDFKQFCMFTKLNKKAAQTELEYKKLLADHNELLAKVAKMEQEKQQLFLICPQNHWNSVDCHADLFAIQPDCLTVYRRGLGYPNDSVSVRAQFVMPRYHSGIFFFELTIEKMAKKICFGLAPISVALTGYGEGNSYGNDGTFWGHNVDGCKVLGNRSYINNTENKFAVGDVVGCGLNLATRQIIYTRNGERLDTSHLFVDLCDLYPMVSLMGAGDRVKANFGPNFLYDLKKEYCYLTVSK